MIELFGLDLNQLPDRRTLAKLLDEGMYASWRERHKSVRDELAARASLGGILLLQKMGCRGELLYDANGRPFFADSDFDFNITHTDGMVVGAIEMPCHGAPESELPCRVGVDAEILSRIASVRICPLAARWFTAAEHELFLAVPTDETFLRIWTRKEALIKWLGEGLRAMRRADTVTARENYGVEFSEYRVGDTLIALCHRIGSTPPESLHMLTGSDLFDL